ncbi:MAG: D-2-hydroxyacid dehydrogenase [Patescibacteria group bacterium]
MKLLIIERINAGVRALRPDHIAAIKRVAPALDVVIASGADDIQAHLRDADIVAGYPATIPAIHGAKNLKWVHSFSAGMDRVLTDEVRESPIILSNSSGIHATPIAEHILGLMLLWTRRFRETLKSQDQGRWEKREDLTELAGKTVLIAGLGDIGLEAARLCKSFRMTVWGTTRRSRERPEFVDQILTDAEMDAALASADFVVVALPYTKATHHRFGAAQFAAMKKSAVIINIGRGAIIDEPALIVALERKEIAGALLDVTEKEPLVSDSPLWGMENVVITPHHSGWSERYMDRAIDRFCLNLTAYLHSDPLPNLVDKEA